MKTKDDDGGPFFPMLAGIEHAGPACTMRDFFAAAALTGLLAYSEPESEHVIHGAAAAAKNAYQYADAMLTERNKA